MTKITVLLILILTLNVGCATLFNNRRQTIHIDSEPKGAEVNSNKLEHQAKTPTTFSFWKGGEVYVTLSKEGYYERAIELDRFVAPSFWANFLAGGLSPVGMATDALSGAMWNYQDTVFATLDPSHDDLSQQPQPGLQRYNAPSQSHWPKTGFSGPTLGFTFYNEKAVNATNKALVLDGEDKQVTRIVTQFGWHFERIFFPKTEKEGVAFVVEFIPLIGGVNHGLFLPSITGMIGMRTADGIEFGMGPTYDGFNTSVTYAGGKTFQYGNVHIPFDIAITPWQDGTTVSILTGFNR